MAHKFVYRWEEVPVVVDLPYAAVILGVSEECLKKRAQRGQFPAFKVGSLWRVSKNDLLVYIENQKTAGPLVKVQS